MSERLNIRARRRGLMVLTGVLASVVTFAVGAGVALAHHSEIVASVDCTNTVTFTATAWSPATDDQRTNHDVDVWYQIGDSPRVYVANDQQFLKSNDFSFSGTFPYPASNPDSITVYVQEQVNWGADENLATPADPRSTVVERPGECPGTPSTSVKVVCSENGTGTVTVTLKNTGGNLPITFEVTPPLGGNPESVEVPANSSVDKTYTGIPNGQYTVAIRVGESEYDQSFTVACHQPPPPPSVSGAPICNEVDASGVISVYWFTVTNGDNTPVTITWSDGTATIPANGTVTIKSASKNVDLFVDETKVASLVGSTTMCGKTVTFDKKLLGQPPTGETYTIRVSRLVPPNFVEVMTFNIDAGVPKTFTLPSTFDPAGITYKVEEVNSGTAVTHVVSPDSFTLNGNLGEAVSVVITNGYAAVHIDKTASTASVKGGDTLSYNLVARNTGGLTLNPVVVTDLMPAQLSIVSATVAGGAGDCTIVRTARPQLLQCTMKDALPVGASTPAITINALVDADAPVAGTILNQAKVLGTYVVPPTNAPPETGDQLSCLPVVAGTVCDLSAKVGVLVESGTASEAPVVPPTVPPTTPTATLPVTGSDTGGLLLLGGLLIGGGAAILLVRRRRPRTS